MEKPGAEIEERKMVIKNSKVKKSKAPKKKASSEKISSTFLFGKWKDLDIDAKQIRKEAWNRGHRYL